MCVQKGEWGRVGLASTFYCPVCSLRAYCPLVCSQRPWPGSRCLCHWGLKSHLRECVWGLEAEDPALDCDFASGATDRTRAACSRGENRNVCMDKLFTTTLE